jgi:hypothetical protein
MTDEPALPPLPDPIRQVVYNESKGYAFSAYTADQMRAYARAAQAQPAASGEPVAWTYTGIKADGSEHGPHLVWNPAYMDAMSASKGAQATPLYAARQPAPEPLTDEQVDRITTEQWGRGLGAPYAAYRAYARAIEQAHGIGAPDAQKGAQP